MTDARPLKAWRKMGVDDDRRCARAGGRYAKPRSSAPAARSFSCYSNYDAILAYNCAHTYALSVALLSDRLR